MMGRAARCMNQCLCGERGYGMALMAGTIRPAHATTLSMHGNIEPSHNLETYVQCVNLQNTHSIRWRTPWVRHEHDTGVRFTINLLILLQHIIHFKHETHVDSSL